MIPLTGYTDRLSATPGERIAFKVSSTAAGPYRASLARVIHADPNPAGPGVKVEDLAHRFSIERPSRAQPIALGSYARVDAAAALRLAGPLTVTALVWPTLARGEQCVVSRWDEAAGAGWALSLGPGGVSARVGIDGGAPLTVSTGAALALRQWHRVWLVLDPAAGTLRAGAAALARGAPREASTPLPRAARPDAPAPILIGARLAPEAGEHFNGKIEDPLVLAAASETPAALVLDPLLPLDGLAAGWDFSQGMDGLDVVDVGPHRLGGRLVNLPTRAVTGARWTGREMCWRHAPREYAAIHFHEDDLHDAGWATDFDFTVPDDLASGAYVMRLAAGAHADELPFYVRPPRGRPTADVLFIASTYTYQAYANHARSSMDDKFRARIAAWGAYPANADDHPEYGRSTYNRHRDGSGICYSSRLRPVLTFRPRYLTFDDPRGSGLRHYPADTHLLDWLERHGIRFDVVTDEDVDAEGAALLAPYATVLTGSHPEYHTARTLDAHAGYLDGGGKLIYLGGNGFYWRIATSAPVPGVLEVRRAEGGIRTWDAQPGEYYHALDGAYGGLWRRNGRPPQQLVGVGFSAQGLFDGSYYRRQAGAADPRAAWILEGVKDEILGNFGLSGGGAAGFELDRADPRLGTPAGAIVVASSEGHASHFVVVPEELLSHISTVSGEPPAKLLRADMTYAELPGGGAIFSVGSITFCGSLSHNGYDNNVSRILKNVVDRFPDPAVTGRIGDAPRGGPVQGFYLPRGTARRPAIARAEGIYLWDADGKRYLDGSSGPVVSNLGHGNRRVLDAMQAQAERATFAYPGLFESEANVALADLVCGLAGPGLERAFFVSGGSEATEAAIKLARQYMVAVGQPERVTVIAREPSYHGSTLGALAVTGDAVAHRTFGPLLRAMPRVPAPLAYRPPDGHTAESHARACADALEGEFQRQGPRTVLAVIMEPVGGLASGATIAPDAYYEAVRATCDRHGALLIFDEVMSGAGRTGRFLAADHWPRGRPDLVTLAKGLAAGYTPFGAVLAPDRVVEAVAQAGGFNHGHTYFTNPLSCAVAHAVVRETVDRDLIGNAARMGARLRERLEAIAARSRVVGDVRGRGLLLAIELVADKGTKRQLPLDLVPAARLCTLALDQGLALYARRTSGGAYGDWVMVTPPLIIDAAGVDELAERLEAALRMLEAELSRGGALG